MLRGGLARTYVSEQFTEVRIQANYGTCSEVFLRCLEVFATQTFSVCERVLALRFPDTNHLGNFCFRGRGERPFMQEEQSDVQHPDCGPFQVSPTAIEYFLARNLTCFLLPR